MKSSRKKLRIMMVASPWLGGSGTVAWQLAESLADKGHEVHFVTYDNPYGKGSGHQKVRIHNVRPFSYSLFPFPLSEMSLAEMIIELSVRYRIDIIHAHYGTLFGHASVLAMNYFDTAKIKPKLIITFHGTDVIGSNPLQPGKNITTYLQKTIIDKADAVTVVSGSLKQLMKKIYNTRREIKVIRNGISIDSDASTTRHAPRSKRFVHISNFRKVKNIPAIIKAFSKFSKIQNDYELKLIGTGPELPKIKALVSAYRINNKVSFLGVLSKNKIRDILADSQALLLPSLYESSPLVILEAFTTATPVIASRVGGIPEMIENGVEGILINDPKNSYKLFGAMKAVVKSDVRHNRMCKKSLARSSVYSLENIVREYVELYVKLIKRKTRNGKTPPASTSSTPDTTRRQQKKQKETSP